MKVREMRTLLSDPAVVRLERTARAMGEVGYARARRTAASQKLSPHTTDWQLVCRQRQTIGSAVSLYSPWLML